MITRKSYKSYMTLYDYRGSYMTLYDYRDFCMMSNPGDFIHLFLEFLTKSSPILIKFNKFLQENVVDFTFKDRTYCRLFSLNFFRHKFRLNISQNSDFLIKNSSK